MDKKHIIFVLVDSLNYTHIKKHRELMPFFTSLENKFVSCENMFSEAPYTEAALMNLICGQDVLQDNGYIFRFKDAKKTVFEAVREKGYYVYTTSYEPQCHPSSVLRGIDEYQYMFGFDPKALWNYRLYHYSNLLEKNELTDNDYKVLYELIGDNLNSWYAWADALESNSPCTEMIGTNSKNYDAKKIKESVNYQRELFENDRKTYIDTILRKGTDHEFFKIDKFEQNNKVKNNQVRSYTVNRFKKIFRKIKRKTFLLNFKKSFTLLNFILKKLWLFIIKPNRERKKDFLKAAYYSLNQLFDFDLYQRLNFNYDNFKDGPSARTHFKQFFSWEEKYNKEMPYFAFLHLNDVHNPEVFFSYDTEDENVINKEAEQAEAVLKKLKHRYYGNITHDLSLKYFDSVLEDFFKELESKNILEDTYVILCADHGYSFSGNPIRDSYVVNLFLENYNIPFVVVGKDLNHKKISELHCSKDIPATICDIIDGEKDDCFTGQSVLTDSEYNSLTIEYCGGGCPDIKRRDIKLAAFNKDYFVGTYGKIYEKASETVSELYDLKKDPLQKHNLRKKKAYYDKITDLLERIDKRKKEISETCKL